MKYRQLGLSGLRVPEVGLGCGSFGTPLMDAAAVNRVISAALDNEIAYFDTADVYGGVGRSEELLGAALQGRRGAALVATKGGLNTGPGANDYGASRRHIMQACEASLKRLRTDVIDVYQLHYPDERTPIDETLRAFDDLIAQGKVRYVGCSNFSEWRLCEAHWVAATGHHTQFCATQSFYNLLYRDAERALIPYCKEYGIGLIPFFPLAGALLTDAYQRNVAPDSSSRGSRPTFRTWTSDRNWSVQEQLKSLAHDRGMTVAQLAIAWLLTRSVIPTVIAGADTAEHVALNAAAIEFVLTAEDLAAIDRIAPVDEDRGRPPIWNTQHPLRWPR